MPAIVKSTTVTVGRKYYRSKKYYSYKKRQMGYYPQYRNKNMRLYERCTFMDTIVVSTQICIYMPYLRRLMEQKTNNKWLATNVNKCWTNIGPKRLLIEQ